MPSSGRPSPDLVPDMSRDRAMPRPPMSTRGHAKRGKFRDKGTQARASQTIGLPILTKSETLSQPPYRESSLDRPAPSSPRRLPWDSFYAHRFPSSFSKGLGYSKRVPPRSRLRIRVRRYPRCIRKQRFLNHAGHSPEMWGRHAHAATSSFQESKRGD